HDRFRPSRGSSSRRSPRVSVNLMFYLNPDESPEKPIFFANECISLGVLMFLRSESKILTGNTRSSYFSTECAAEKSSDVSVGRIFEILRFIFIKETTNKVAENSSTAHDRFHPS
ncbi:hypothetical protein CSKR_102760, partial [Clonorchis sinensis]